MAIAIAAQFIPQTKAAEPFKPIPVRLATSIVAGSQELYISGGRQYRGGARVSYTVDQFIALDLGRSWTSDAPAWKKLKFHKANQDGESQGTVGSTLGNDLLFFTSNGTYVYNIATDDWSKDDALTLPLDAMGSVTVNVKDIIYGMDKRSKPDGTWRFTEVNTTSKTYTFTEHQGPPYPSGFASLAYSPISDTIFAYEYGNPLWSFSLTSKTWAIVNGTGDVPSYRYDPCLTASQDGTVLILAGGFSEIEDPSDLNEVYSFD
ncbi:hypothetical protein BGX31_002929, partial [Mortierella sp. GBA43]